MEGWISLHRKIIDWEWYSDTITFRVFFHLLITANHKDMYWKGITIKRGQTFTSYQHIIDEMKDKKITIKNVRTAISHLKKTGEVAAKVAGNGLLVTIVNYDLYQTTQKETADHRAIKWQASGNKQ